MEGAKAAEKLGEIVVKLRGSDGKFRPFLTRLVPLSDDTGRVARWFGTSSDISGQEAAEARAMRSEAELQDNEYRLRLATEAGGVGVWEWRLTTNEMIYSPRARAICGFPLDGEVTYEMVAAVTHPEDFPRTSAQAKRAVDPAIRDHSPYRYRLLLPTGEVRWVLASGEAVFEEGSDGEVATRYVGTLIDVTEQHKTREQLLASQASLRESEEQLRLATEAAEIGLWDVNPLSDRLYWPPRVKAMFGIAPDATVSMSEDFFPCLHPEDREKVVAAYQRATNPAERALYDVEYRTIGKEDGIVRWVAAKGRAIFNANRECVRVIGTAVDITERKRTEVATLRQSRSLQVLNATGAALAAELELETIVQIVTDAGVDITHGEFGAFFYNVTAPEGDSYTLYALSGVERSAFDHFPMPRATSVFGPTFRGEGLVRSADITADSRYGKNAPFEGMPEGHLPVRSYLAVPVVSRSGEVSEACSSGIPNRACSPRRLRSLSQAWQVRHPWLSIMLASIRPHSVRLSSAARVSSDSRC
ncbi:MAG: PAS domain-containing protein [Hyphomonadaceae bacterium]|nr:PAS domain-containing protein [Hyphomonadaceae bacterium]